MDQPWVHICPLPLEPPVSHLSPPLLVAMEPWCEFPESYSKFPLAVYFTYVSVYVRRRQWHPTPVLFLENPIDGGVWWAAVHGVAKSPMRLSDFTFTFHFHALEKEMATHSSVLAWRIPGMGEPGGLPSMGSHRVGHD